MPFEKVLLLMSENDRAAIACLRSLDEKVQIIPSFNNKSIFNSLIVPENLRRNITYYNSNNEEDFINSLIQIKKKHGSFKVFLFGDQTSYWLLTNKKRLLSYNIYVKGPETEAYTTMLNKKNFLEISSEYGMLIPKTINYIEVMNKKFEKKFVIKPKESTENERILDDPMLIENKKSFQYLKSLDLDFDNHILQEYVYGPSVYYMSLYNNGDKIIDFTQKNIAQQPGGKSVIKAIPSEIPEYIKEKVDALMRDFNWTGPMMIEFKLMDDKYYNIECNPRLWGPLQLAIDNGINFANAMYEPSNYKNKNDYKAEKEVGYLWKTGYLLGFLYKITTKTNFQRYNVNKEFIFKDVWFRKGTRLYSIIEFPLTIIKILKNRLFKKVDN